MSIVAHAYPFVIGVDTHARNHALSILVAATGAVVDEAQFPATGAGMTRAVDWVGRRTGGDLAVLWVIECVGSYGAGLASAVTEAGYHAVEAARMNARANRGVGKSDPLDARRIAASVLPLEVNRLRHPRKDDGVRAALRVLVAGKLYLCAVKDAWSNRIVGYSIDSRMKASLAVAALRNAVQRRRPGPGCIVHSDRGSQFGSKAFRRELETYRLAGSMGQVGSSADNAAMESFFALPWTLGTPRWSGASSRSRFPSVDRGLGTVRPSSARSLSEQPARAAASQASMSSTSSTYFAQHLHAQVLQHLRFRDQTHKPTPFSGRDVPRRTHSPELEIRSSSRRLTESQAVQAPVDYPPYGRDR